MRKNKRYLLCLVTGITVAYLFIGVCYANDDEKMIVSWNDKENVTRRLAAEWYKIDKLNKEINMIEDVLGSMREMEFYPESVTGFNEKQLLTLDRKLEKIEKLCKKHKERVVGLKLPVSDALKIVHEMVIGEPLESMFAALETDNIKRIKMIIEIGHGLDTMWYQVDTLLNDVCKWIGIDRQKTTNNGPIEEEFFELLKKNIGLRSEHYYDRIQRLKMYFIKNTQAGQLSLMEKIELQRINKLFNAGNYGLVEQKISDAMKWFSPKNNNIHELYYILSKIKIHDGEWGIGDSIARLLPVKQEYAAYKVLASMKCGYFQKKYNEVLLDTTEMILGGLNGASLNRAIWFIIESAIEIGHPEIGIRFAGFINKEAPYAAHVLHALSKMFVSSNDYENALAVVKQGLEIKPKTNDDQYALMELNMMYAEILFEQKQYAKAIKKFYSVINKKDMFERSLTGIAWCYLKSGYYSKAELTLRKLINQSPESVYGVEGIYVLAKRNIQAAQHAWKRYVAIENEKIKIASIAQKVENISKSDTGKVNKGKIRKARQYLIALLKKVTNERVGNYQSISKKYDNAEKLLQFVKKNYYTGTFQEVTFSKGRENILNIVDSVLYEIKSMGKRKDMYEINEKSTEKDRIKKVVTKSICLSVICLIERYYWEKNYVEWQKKNINRQNEYSDSIALLLFGKKANAGNNKNIELDSLIRYEEEIDRYYEPVIIKEIKKAITLQLTENDRCYLKYQLAELFYKKENAEYSEKYSELEKKYIHNNDTSVYVQSSIDHSNSLLYYDSVVKNGGGDSLIVGGALYGIGWCYNDIGMQDSAYHYMKYLAEKYPDNPHTPQAWMYCGEYNFDKGILDTALQSYYKVMKYPESEWFNEALYKVAWTQYRMSNPQKAISSFLALVDLGGGKFGKALLEKESIDYIAISFSEIDMIGNKGLKRAEKFVKKMGDIKRGCAILYRLAQVYKEQGRYGMAREAFDYLLESYPEYAMNYMIEKDLLSVLEREYKVQESLKKKYAYFSKYNRQSNWAKKQSKEISHIADSIAAVILYDVAVSYHQIALKENSDSMYSRAMIAYDDYIHMYKKSTLANECHYNLAEIKFSLGHYYDAVKEFIAVSREYPESKYKETAAWNAIVAAQNVLKEENGRKNKNNKPENE